VTTARLRQIVFATSFGFTGVGTALLGATLPATLHEWHLSDSSGGTLLFCAWAGSTTGALFARGTTGIAALPGLLLAAAGLVLLGRGVTTYLPAVFLLYGLGLGMTMTAISIRRAHEVPAGRTDVEMNRLNLVWALGACVAPWLAVRSLRVLSVLWLFRAFSLVLTAAALTVLAVLAGPKGEAITERFSAPKEDILRSWAPLRLCLFAAASVGLESAIGSWLTTYAERSTLALGTAVSANSIFWAGLLLSRALHSAYGARVIHTRVARAGHILAVGVAMLLLLFYPSRLVLPLAGLLCGFGLGPLYPFVLSVALPRYRSVAVFLAAGFGASLLPWATGALSSACGSLRLGLLAPAACFIALAAVAVRMRTELV